MTRERLQPRTPARASCATEETTQFLLPSTAHRTRPGRSPGTRVLVRPCAPSCPAPGRWSSRALIGRAVRRPLRSTVAGQRSDKAELLPARPCRLPSARGGSSNPDHPRVHEAHIPNDEPPDGPRHQTILTCHVLSPISADNNMERAGAGAHAHMSIPLLIDTAKRFDFRLPRRMHADAHRVALYPGARLFGSACSRAAGTRVLVWLSSLLASFRAGQSERRALICGRKLLREED